MTLEETVLAIRLHKLAVALGVFIVSAPAFSHGHHSHGKPLTEVEQKAANGVFDDANVQNRNLSDWDGVWQSVYPLLQSGKLDPVFQKKADADKTKTFAEIKDYYHKGYATDIEMIGIEDGIVEFHRNNETTSCKYDYDGYKILTYKSVLVFKPFLLVSMIQRLSKKLGNSTTLGNYGLCPAALI